MNEGTVEQHPIEGRSADWPKVLAWALMWQLIALAIIGAFLGARSAARLFSSPPLVAFWAVFGVISVGAALSRRIRRSPGLLALHVAPAVILVGGLIGSQHGHVFLREHMGTDKVREGYLLVTEGAQQRMVRTEAGELRELPFGIALRDFSVVRYPPEDLRWMLLAHPEGGVTPPAVLDWAIGKPLSLAEGRLQVTVLAYGDAAGGATVEAGEDDLPAMVLSVWVNGAENRRRLQPDPETRIGVLRVPINAQAAEEEAVPGFRGPTAWQLYLVEPTRPVRSYRSRVAVMRNEEVVREATIEVNRPLHYGGYHLYQHSFGGEERRYTVLKVISDTGLAWVYAGYVLLLGGVFWWGWMAPALAFFRKRRRQND